MTFRRVSLTYVTKRFTISSNVLQEMALEKHATARSVQHQACAISPMSSTLPRAPALLGKDCIGMKARKLHDSAKEHVLCAWPRKKRWQKALGEHYRDCHAEVDSPSITFKIIEHQPDLLRLHIDEAILNRPYFPRPRKYRRLFSETTYWPRRSRGQYHEENNQAGIFSRPRDIRVLSQED